MRKLPAGLVRPSTPNTKTKTRLGFWVYAAGNTAQITAETQRYKVHILGINESRWTGSARIIRRDCTILRS